MTTDPTQSDAVSAAPRPTIIVTDPGQDDAVAILTALGSPEDFDVLALIAAAGNATLENATRNSLRILELAGRTDIPVHSGPVAPLRRPLITAAHVHGPMGLDGVDWADPTTPASEEDGVSALVRLLRAAAPASVTVMILSPFTPMAAALVQAPEIVDSIAEIVVMAGAYLEGGNITPAAEFNVYVDPEAVDIVLTCGAPLTIMPLDVSHKLRATPARLDAFRSAGHVGAVVADLLGYSQNFDLAKYGWDGAPLHDPSVTVRLIRPEIFSGRQVSVRVETQAELAIGTLSVDWWSVTDETPNAMYIMDGDADAYFALITERLARLG